MQRYRYLLVHIIFFVIWVPLSYGIPHLSVEDEIVMSQLVKNSYDINELKLCLKLFPETPYRSKLEKRLFKLEIARMSFADKQKYATLEKYNIDFKRDRSLSATDDLTMSRMLENSYDPKALQLFIKLFPGSAFRPVFESRLKRLLATKAAVQSGKKLSQTVHLEALEQENEALKEIKAGVSEQQKKDLENITQSATKNKPVINKDASADIKQPKVETKEPEVDWAKFEFGMPQKLIITDTDGNSVTNDGDPLGVYVGWSKEYLFDIGIGGGSYYFSQKLEHPIIKEVQHLYFDVQGRAIIIGHINLGISYGFGTTTFTVQDGGDYETIPGVGRIQTLSVGLKYKYLGINYMMVNFSGECQLVDKRNASKSKLKWKGTTNMLTFEYYY